MARPSRQRRPAQAHVLLRLWAAHPLGCARDPDRHHQRPLPRQRPHASARPARLRRAAAVMIAWHLPPLYDATLRSDSLHVVEHLMFIGAGLVLYWPILEATSAYARWQMSPAIKLLYMLVATLPQDGVALVLLFSRVPFYDFYVQAPRLVPSLTPLIDQTLAGATLMILGKAAMAIAAMAVFFRWFGREHLEDRARLTWLR